MEIKMIKLEDGQIIRWYQKMKVLDIVDFDGKKGWKQGDALTSADLKGYKATNVRYSRYGNTAILQFPVWLLCGDSAGGER